MEQNLLIVDDEMEILDWLKELFTYEFDRDVQVYTARSGQRALELLNQIKFDVVLTDIHMPKMDGITLFRKVKENWPRCKTVFLTGYHNFEDVYQVIQHKDVRYVLKSERDEVILKAVREAFDEIVREMEEEGIRRRQEEKLRTANDWLRRNFLQELFSGRISGERMKKELAELGISLDPEKEVLVFLLRVDTVEEGNEQKEEYVSEILGENLPSGVQHCIYIQEKKHIFCLLQPKEAEDENWDRLRVVAQGAVEYAQEVFRASCNVTFSVVVKGMPVALEQLGTVSVRMKQIMVSYVGKNREMMVREEEMETEDGNETASNVVSQIPMLKSYMELGKRKEYFELLHRCANQMQGKSRHDMYAMEIYYSISTLLLQFVNENHIYRQLAFKTGMYKLMKLDEHEDWYRAGDFLFEVSNAIFDLLADKENTLSERALSRVEEYIENHLSEDLPLKTLAEVGGFNASYLSRLFRQMSGQTLTEYITERRMKKAQKLLTETDKKIQDITAETGYMSAQSFARAFRSYTGLAPAEYRELHHSR